MRLDGRTPWAEAQADAFGERIARDLPYAALAPGPLPAEVRRRAEAHLGADLRGTALASAPGTALPDQAVAVTRGETISFRPGWLDGQTAAGRSLLGHELVHVAQQQIHGPAAQHKLVGDIKSPDVTVVPGTGGPQRVVIDGVPILEVTGTEMRLDSVFDSTTVSLAIRVQTNGSVRLLHGLDFLADMYPSLKGLLEVQQAGMLEMRGEMAERRPTVIRNSLRFGGGGGGRGPAGTATATAAAGGERGAAAPSPARAPAQPAGAPPAAAAAAAQPRSLDRSLDPAAMSKGEIEREIFLIHQWLLSHAADERAAALQAQVARLERELAAIGELTDFQMHTRGRSEYVPVYDPEDGTVVGYYRESGGYEEIVDLAGHVQWADERGLETPLLDPIDFVPTPGTAVKLGAGILKGSAKLIGKAIGTEVGEAAVKTGSKAAGKLFTGKVLQAGAPFGAKLLGALRVVARLFRPAVTAAEKEAVELAVAESRKALGKVVVNIGGAGEVAGAINLNTLADQAVKGIPNLVKAGGERLGKLFGPGTVDEIVSNNIVFGQVNWVKTLKGAFSALKKGGTVSIAPYAASLAEHREQIVAALRAAGFQDIAIEFGGVVIRAVKP